MRFFSRIKTPQLGSLKILDLLLYKKYEDKGFVIREYMCGLLRYKKNFSRKKIYVLGLQVFSKTDKLLAIENLLNIQAENIKRHVNRKLQEYKVKQQKMLSIAALHQQVFPQFRGKHIGESIAIVGCGPTLNYFQPIKNIHYIALNRSISYDKVHFDYYFNVDAHDDMRDWYKKYSNYDCIKFYGQHFNFVPPISERGCSNIPDADALRDNAYRYYSNAFDLDFYPDISTCPLIDYGSVAFCALHFSLYTVPDKIYLVGCDCTNNGYFNDAEQKPWVLLDKTLEGYKRLKKFVAIYYPDTEIISVNPVGLKGLFKDVYTQSYVDEHPELLVEDIVIIDKEKKVEV